MNRNVNSHFAYNPTSIDISRSSFNRSYSHKTSFNVGDLIPIHVEEVLPGDSFNVKTSKVVRLQTLLTPMMDNMYLDTYYFFVPNRLVWSHWKNFMGENTESAWIPETEYTIPQITAPAGGFEVGTIADYMGIPTGVDGISVTSLPFRAYALICNEWFRSENLTDPLNIPVGDATVTGSNGSNYISDVAKGGKPFKAAKYFDYFTGALPFSPQKGPDVRIPTETSGMYPVKATSQLVPDYDSQNAAARYVYVNGDWLLRAGYGSTAGTWNSTQHVGSGGLTTADAPANLWALAEGGLGVTINQLRTAFQIQKFYEKSARGGSRYIETLKVMFGVTSPDARMQRPEYLGGNRVPININQVIQQSGTGSASQTPQGTVTGMSLTTDTHFDFSKSFTEHGFIIGLCVARYDHTYQQGIERFWSRKDKFDYYWPVFANLGEMPIRNKEIYADGSSADDEVFGYQEAWADYRYKPNRVSGEMRSTYAQSLDVWHLGDKYTSLPHLSDSWLREDMTNVDRVLAVQSSNANQLFMDVFIKNKAVRPMPLFSIPGLIDHH